MRFGLSVFASIALLAGGSAAQTALPPLDVSGGFTGVRMEPGADLDRRALPGWNASIAAYPFGRFGAAAEFAGSRRSPNLSDTLVPDTNVKLSRHTFLFGPSIRILRRDRLTTSFRALFGVARGRTELEPGLSPSQIGVFENETVFATAFGSVWDIKLSRLFAWRVNPSMLFTRFGGETQFTPRFSTGLVFRFGIRRNGNSQ